MPYRHLSLTLTRNHFTLMALLLTTACVLWVGTSIAWAANPTEKIQTIPARSSVQDQTQAHDQAQIDSIQANIGTQAQCWNDGDIDGFMETYWQSEELTFSSGGNTTRGWQATKDRYKKNYNSRQKMGQLQFANLEVRLLATESALVLGRWELTLADGTKPGGNFSLVLKKFDGQWKIIHDHTSLAKPEPGTPSP